MRIRKSLSVSTIQAIDDGEGSFYVLRRPGYPPIAADWPQPLEQLCPSAVRIPAAFGADTTEFISA